MVWSSLAKKEAEAAYKLAVKVDKTLDSVYSSLANLQIDLGKRRMQLRRLRKLSR